MNKPLPLYLTTIEIWRLKNLGKIGLHPNFPNTKRYNSTLGGIQSDRRYLVIIDTARIIREIIRR